MSCDDSLPPTGHMGGTGNSGEHIGSTALCNTIAIEQSRLPKNCIEDAEHLWKTAAIPTSLNGTTIYDTVGSKNTMIARATSKRRSNVTGVSRSFLYRDIDSKIRIFRTYTPPCTLGSTSSPFQAHSRLRQSNLCPQAIQRGKPNTGLILHFRIAPFH